jgi:histone deacetylase 1/2
MHSNTKHIPVKYNFIREQVNDKIVKLEYVPTKEQIADVFTELLPKVAFEYLRQGLGVQQIPQ